MQAAWRYHRYLFLYSDLRLLHLLHRRHRRLRRLRLRLLLRARQLH